MAREVGFCFGVERAIRMAKEAVKGARGKVYSYGQLVHNRRVVEELRALGIEPLERITAEVPERGDTLVIRAHGAPPEVYDEVEGRGVSVVDTTCPIVEKARRNAARLKEEGYEVVVVGDEEHPEVKGVLGCLEGGAFVVRRKEEVEWLSLPEGGENGRVGVVAQTTESLEELASVVLALLPKVRELKVVNTICDAVIRRQRETEELAKTCDIVVVVGGRNSANTRRLVEIAQRFCPRVLHIEEHFELKGIDLPEEAVVGVSAGTSTPREQVEEVVRRLRRISREA